MKLFSSRSFKNYTAIFILSLLNAACNEKKQTETTTSSDPGNSASGFQNDVNFLKNYTEIITLQNASGKGKIAVSAALQGRVMTSTSDGDDGMSYGWINRQAFLSGDTSDHINVFGGEDRLWFGPEGGQYSVYFAQGKEFNLDNWYVPRLIDLEPFTVASVTQAQAVFTKESELINYSGTVFQIGIRRTVRMLEEVEASRQLGIETANGASLVAYQTVNELKNRGKSAWEKSTGLLSIWILGMFNPSPGTTILVPYHGKSSLLREIVNDNYFGRVPDDRLKLVDKTIYFKADGLYRSKIGLLPDHAPQWLGSYDADRGVLTVVTYNKPDKVKPYVNSLWEMQKEPYKGDAINAYNDGPPAPGAKPLGPFYELETSSPAAQLQPDSLITHIHSTFHFRGTPDQLDPILTQLLGISTKDVATTF